jgi:hypothetical protein
MRTWIRNAGLEKIYAFAICGLGHQGNLRICDAQKFADLGLWNESKNLRI